VRSAGLAGSSGSGSAPADAGMSYPQRIEFHPTDAAVPPELRTPRLLLRPLRATDVELDYDAVMSSAAMLRAWSQSHWPADDFTLAEKDRLTLLPGIARAYAERVMDHLKIVRGEVTTAVPLAADKLRVLEQGLAQATGRKVMLEARVDPSIIGGVVTRLGSTVYDGSVTTQLQKMKQSLIEAGQ